MQTRQQTSPRTNRRPSRIARAGALGLLVFVLAVAFTGQALGKKPATPQQPAASTGGAGHAHGTAVELQGSVRPGAEPVTYVFEFGPTNAYGLKTTPGTLAAGTTAVKVSAIASPFLVGYHYRLVVTPASGKPVFGKDHTYTAKTTQLKVVIVKPSALTQNLIGSPITVNGNLTGSGAPNHKVVLQASPYPYTGGFVNVGLPQSSDSVGRFSFRIASLTGNTQYRVVTLDPRPAFSSVITELASVRVTLHVRTSSRPGLVRLYGTVSPALSGAHVFFQLKQAPSTRRKPPQSEKAEERAEAPRYSSKFGTTVKHATKTFSRFSEVVTVKTAGRYRALVIPAKGPLSSGYSATVVLRAAPSTKKHKKQKS